MIGRLYQCKWCKTTLKDIDSSDYKIKNDRCELDNCHFTLCKNYSDDLNIIPSIQECINLFCDNDYCYTRYLAYSTQSNMFYTHKSEKCDFCEYKWCFKRENNMFCCGMCMDKYDKCLVLKTSENTLFVNLKKWQQYKIELNKKIKETDKKIKNLSIQITHLTIE